MTDLPVMLVLELILLSSSRIMKNELHAKVMPNMLTGISKKK